MTDFTKEWLIDTFKSGKTNSITGNKGGGKTHFAVWLIPIFIDMGFVILTNILFKKCIGIDKDGRKIFEKDYPPNVIKIESLTDLLREISKQLLKNPNQPFIFLWDELQNSLSAYDWNTELFKAIIKFFSISRKFGLDDPNSFIKGGLCVTVMSPSFMRGIPAGIREELDNAFLKDEEIYEIFMNRWSDGRMYDPKEIVFYKRGSRNILNQRTYGEVIEVGTTNLCDERNCKVDDFVYEQKGFAFIEFGFFDNGKKLGLKEFQDFLSYSSKVLPQDLPQAILEYLKGAMNKCRMCGTETPNPKYCSKECKDKAYYQRKVKQSRTKSRTKTI